MEEGEASETMAEQERKESVMRMEALPLVGMVHRDRRSPLERVYEASKLKYKYFLRQYRDHDHGVEKFESSTAPESSESDLACMEESFFCYQPKPCYDNDLFKLYMLVDWDSQPVHNMSWQSLKSLDKEKEVIPHFMRLKNQLKEWHSHNVSYYSRGKWFDLERGIVPRLVRLKLKNWRYQKYLKIRQTFSMTLDQPHLTLDLPRLTQCISGFNDTLLQRRAVELSVVSGELAKILSIPSCVCNASASTIRTPGTLYLCSMHVLEYDRYALQ